MTMTELEETIALANRILDRPYADPDDDLAMLSRQLLRSVELIHKLKRDLASQFDPMLDLVHANRDVILQKHEEAIRLIRKEAEADGIKRVLDIIHALNLFHPMYAESWEGWPL